MRNNMLKVPKLSFLVISLTLFSCIKYNSLNIKSLIIETQFSGDHVVFADLSKDLLNKEILNVFGCIKEEVMRFNLY